MFRYCYIALSLVAIVIAAITVSTFGIADGLSIVAAMAVAWIVPLAVARRCSWWSPACTMTYNAIALLIIASGIFYIWFRTLHFEGYTLEMPYLYQDGKKYYNWALNHYDGRCPEPNITFVGYSLVILGLFKVLGVSIVWPMAMNIMLTLTSVIMCGSLAATVTRGRTCMLPSHAATLAIMLLGTHCYFLSHSYLILKEASIYVAIGMMGMALVWLQDQSTQYRRTLSAIGLYAGACIILALVRAKYINFAAIGLVLLTLQRWRTRWRSISVLASITVLAWLVGMWCSATYSVNQQIDNVVGGDAMTQSFGHVGNIQGGYLGALGGYFHLPTWKKLLLLPVTTGTQYIIPFPWGETKDGWISIFPRIRMGWYLCGGLTIIYYLMLSWRRKHSLGLVAWWPVICYMGIAFICAGSVSRYILPFQPLFVAIAVYVVALIRTDNTLRRPLLTAYAVYAIALVTSLVGAIFIIS